MYINPLTAIDFYKADHRRQYPEGTTEVYSNFTARSSKLAKTSHRFDDKVVMFGLQYFIKHFLIETWNNNFFNLPKSEVIEVYKQRMDSSLGEGCISVDHIETLHDLGYLPVRIKALPEGSRVNIKVPVITIVNTHPDFFWLTNYLETVMSCYLWKPITTATLAFEYKRMLVEYATNTGSSKEFVQFQSHDFSMRGMSCIQDAYVSGAGHLTSFLGTDTVPAIDMLEKYYNAYGDFIGGSVPATEHSVMCMGTKDGEIDTFKRLINDIYPSGVVSIVSDTWDLWQVVTEFCSELKDDILNRDGKVVIRPDSGNPVKIICGDWRASEGSPEKKGAVECLWDIFGGTVTESGHKLLDSHIGLIYGDSITIEIATYILDNLEKQGFASGNIVFGIGAYTYQYVTRDTFGFAMKATGGVVNGERREIYKDPKTDNGLKKSAKGLLRVEKEGSNYVLYDQQTEEQEKLGELKTVFEDGKLLSDISLSDIREKLSG